MNKVDIKSQPWLLQNQQCPKSRLCSHSSPHASTGSHLPVLHQPVSLPRLLFAFKLMLSSENKTKQTNERAINLPEWIPYPPHQKHHSITVLFRNPFVSHGMGSALLTFLHRERAFPHTDFLRPRQHWQPQALFSLKQDSVHCLCSTQAAIPPVSLINIMSLFLLPMLMYFTQDIWGAWARWLCCPGNFDSPFLFTPTALLSPPSPSCLLWMFPWCNFTVINLQNIKSTILTVFSVWISSIKYIHNITWSSPLFVLRTFSSSQTESPYPLNNNPCQIKSLWGHRFGLSSCARCNRLNQNWVTHAEVPSQPAETGLSDPLRNQEKER